MSVLFSLLSKKKDRELRQSPAYLGLADQGFSVSQLGGPALAPSFELTIEGYVCLIAVEEQHLVATLFFSLDDERFRKKLRLIEKFTTRKDFLVGRNFIAMRTPFNRPSTLEIASMLYPLLSIAQHESFPPMDHDMVLRSGIVANAPEQH